MKFLIGVNRDNSKKLSSVVDSLVRRILIRELTREHSENVDSAQALGKNIIEDLIGGAIIRDSIVEAAPRPC